MYLLGWVFVQPISLFYENLSDNEVSLLGTFTSFLLFLWVLPLWTKYRWQESKAFYALGITGNLRGKNFVSFMKGLAISFFLLGLIVLLLLFSNGGAWTGSISLGNFFNALFLLVVVGLAEELVFRGWLWGDLNYLSHPRWAIFAQALIFSVAHIRLDLEVWPLSKFSLDFGTSFSLHVGWFLLGILLALRRILDKGSLFGCIGLHGGLVGGWFLVQEGLIDFSTDGTIYSFNWLLGIESAASNPLGGLFAISIFLILIISQRKALAMALRPSTGARKAS